MIWAIIWGASGVLVGILSEAWFSYSLETHIDPLGALAIPGFLSGIAYIVLLRLLKKKGRKVECSYLKMALMGAGLGFLLGILAFALGTPSEKYPLKQIMFIIIATSTLLSFLSALGSAVVVRFIRRDKFLNSSRN